MAPKPVFTNVKQALAAVRNDGLACAYRKAKEVFVITAFGSGKFSVKEWDEAVLEEDLKNG